MRRPNLGNAALLAGSVIFMLILLEVGLRLYAGVYEGAHVLWLRNFIGDKVDQFRGNTHSVYDERLGWVAKPNVHSRFFNTDMYGTRLAGRVDRPLPQGAILASGDSFTFGDDVHDNESWPAYLEAITGTPVINAAYGAWGTDQIVMRAEEMLEIAHPKVLILGYFWHDMERTEHSIMFGAQKPYYTIEAGEPVLHNVPVPRFSGMVQELGWARTVLGYSYTFTWFAERLGFQGWLYPGFIKNKRATTEGTGEQISCLLMQRLKQHSAAAQIRLLLVMQYEFGVFAEPQPQAALAVLNCARDLGFEIVDTWAPLSEIRTSNPRHFSDLFRFHQAIPGHMSALGNWVVATAIAERLEGRKN